MDSKVGLLGALIVTPLLVGSALAHQVELKRIDTIPIPGAPLTSFDISWVDPVNELYFLSDRSNKAVDVFDAANDAFLRRIDGFAGANGGVTSGAGPDGVVSTGPTEVWAGDGDSTAKVIDLTTNTVVATISTGGIHRVDEMAFDARDHLLLAANNADTPPFLTLFDTQTRTIVKGHITVADQTGQATGIEQPAFSNVTGLFYASVPSLGSDASHGAVAVIDTTGTVIATIPIEDCSPTGLSVGPRDHLVVGCDEPVTVIISATQMMEIARITEVGGADEVWFNPGDRNYYISGRNNPASQGGPVLGFINAERNEFVGSVPTEAGAHSVAADPRNNHVFVPIDAGKDPAGDPKCDNGCIAVFSIIDDLNNESSDNASADQTASADQ
jgi:hypothetical protein